MFKKGLSERRRTETPQTQTFMLQPRPSPMESDKRPSPSPIETDQIKSTFMESDKRPSPMMMQKQVLSNIRPGSYIKSKPVRSENFIPPEPFSQHVARVSQKYRGRPPKGYSYPPGEEVHSEYSYGQFVDPSFGGKSRRNRKRKTRKSSTRKMKRRRRTNARGR